MSTTTRTASSAPEGAGAVRTVRITWTTAVVGVSIVIAYLVLRGAFVAAHRVIGWATASVAVAVFVEPVVQFLGRFIPRVLAVILTFLVLAAAGIGLVFGTVDDLDREVGRLEEVTPAAVDDLEARDDWAGNLARELNASERLDSFLLEVDRRVGSGTDALAQNAPALPVYFVAAIFTIFLLVYGPKIAAGAAERIEDPDRRNVVRETVAVAVRRARWTVSAMLAQGVAVGVAAWAAAAWLDLPAPIVLGLVAGVGGMLPDFGVVLGVFPTAGLAAAFESGRAAAAILVGALIVQFAEIFWFRLRVNRVGVHLGPAVIWIVALVGYTVYGIGMAFYGAVYAVFVLAIIDEVPRARDGLAPDPTEARPA